MTPPAGPFLLAVDAGTGSCRALLFGPSGEQVAVSLREWTHREPADAPGGQDFDVEANWTAITACIRDALRSADIPFDRVWSSDVYAVEDYPAMRDKLEQLRKKLAEG